jgi:monoamine oxidase
MDRNVGSESSVKENNSSEIFDVAIIGGGPGGMFTAWHLAAKVGPSCRITIYEASDRLGGKIVTKQFAGVGPYEAGVAEIYDYSRLGPDPLHDLIVNELGLEIKYIAGGPCVIDGAIVTEAADLEPLFSKNARLEVEAFRERCAELMNPQAYYLSVAERDNVHPWATISGEELLKREVKDEIARRYIRAMAHSDVAAAPHNTNGLTFLKNVLMDRDGYMDVFSVVGGNEQIVTRLADQLDADVVYNANVTAVEPLANGQYRLDMAVGGVRKTAVADYVVLSLPLTALSSIHLRDESLDLAMHEHIKYFDRPAHYVRATLLFKRPFWRDKLWRDWWMLDEFDGCCVYDESARHDYGGMGALAFLIAGNPAMALANIDDRRIVELCLEALPPDLAEGHELLIDARVHRWMASVNAIPGGFPVRPRAVNHRPDPKRAPRLLVTGDYIFDATLNGVLDSADAATDFIVSDVLLRRKAASEAEGDAPQRATADAIERLQELVSVDAVVDVLQVAWNLGPGARVLHVGSGAGGMVAALRERGFDAIGVEFDGLANALTPRERRAFNREADLASLPFEDFAFDAVIDTGLYRFCPQRVAQAIAEIRRVTRFGLILGSVTTDLAIDFIERFGLLYGAEILNSRWDWAEKFYSAGFTHALASPDRLDEAWAKAKADGAGPGQWYEDAESLLYSVYEVASVRHESVSEQRTAPASAPPETEELVAV